MPKYFFNEEVCKECGGMRLTKKEILEKAIEKVEKYGHYKMAIDEKDWYEYIFTRTYYRLIFRHTFARAFARYLIAERKQQAYEVLDGTFPFYRGENREHFITHLTQYVEELKKELLRKMVVEKEPLEYLEKFWRKDNEDRAKEGD